MQTLVNNTCTNCNTSFKGKYCNACGEKVYTEHDKSVLHFFEEGLHFITHFEGTLLVTLKTIFTTPGKLSLDYSNGIRKKYFKPLSFFLLLVVLYLLFPLFQGLNQYLKYYPSNRLYGNFAYHKIQEVKAATGLTMEQLSEKFHIKSEKNSKFLLIVIIPFTALFFWASTFKKRKYFYDQMVFSAEINSVYLLWGFLLFPLLTVILNLFSKLLTGSSLPLQDGLTGIIIYIVLCIYVAMASRKFYNISRKKSILLSLAFFVAHYFIVHFIYKFLLFAITINQIH